MSGNLTVNGTSITAPNLGAGANTDLLVTITAGGVIREASVATMIGGVPWVVGGNTTAPANGIIGINVASTQDLQFFANGSQAAIIDDATLKMTINNDFEVGENTTLGSEDSDLIDIWGVTTINTSGTATTSIGSATAGQIDIQSGLNNDMNFAISGTGEMNISGLAADATATTILVQDGSGNVKTRTVGTGTTILTGTGTVNTLSKFTAAGVLGDASVTDDGTTVEFSTAAVEMPNLPNDVSASNWIVTYNNTTGALEKKDLGTPVQKTLSGTALITGDGILTVHPIAEVFVAAGATITCTLQDGTDANDYIVTITAITPATGFDVRLSGGAMAPGATKTLHYSITNP